MKNLPPSSMLAILFSFLNNISILPFSKKVHKAIYRENETVKWLLVPKGLTSKKNAEEQLLEKTW